MMAMTTNDDMHGSSSSIGGFLAQVEQLKGDLETKRAQIMAAEMRVCKLTGQRKQKKTELTGVLAENSSIRMQIFEKESTKLKKQESRLLEDAEYGELLRERDAVTVDLAEVTKTLASFQEKRRAIEKELEEHEIEQRKYQNRHPTNIALREAKAKLRLLQANLDEQISAFEGENAGLKEEIKRMDSNLEEQQRQQGIKNRLRSAMATKMRKSEYMKQVLIDETKSMKDLEKVAATLSTKIAAVYATIAEKENEYQRLQTEYSSMMTSVDRNDGHTVDSSVGGSAGDENTHPFQMPLSW